MAIRIAAFLMLAAIAFVSINNQKHRPQYIPPGRATTRVTEPLNEQGEVDYVAALNQAVSAGVTAENNALVPLRESRGPSIRIWRRC